MKTIHYIINDQDGIWLTTKPAPGDEILFASADEAKAEYALSRYLAASD